MTCEKGHAKQIQVTIRRSKKEKARGHLRSKYTVTEIPLKNTRRGFSVARGVLWGENQRRKGKHNKKKKKREKISKLSNQMSSAG